MLNFENAVCEGNGNIPVEKRETAKMILENMDAILNEIENQLWLIDAGICNPKQKNGEVKEPVDGCMLDTLQRQRNKAEEILKIAIHIREGLW